ncbi:hypothetical protein HYDPIDRAFT_61421, partial [Hydnomerulius pinastri MD-312]
GHGFRGDYYARFVPSESTECQCGHPLQTREHILSDCPLFEPYRHHLRAVSHSISPPFILGTKAGLTALTKFTQSSRAFAKATAQRDRPPAQPHEDQDPL